MARKRGSTPTWTTDTTAPLSARACLYHRVSTIDQDPGLARAELQQAAQVRGLRVTLDIEETGSGANNDRPGLQRVLEAARKGEVSTVIVWKLDRFGRSAFDLLANLRQLQDAGVRFIALSQGIDIKPGGDPMSKLLVTMLSAVAEFERDLIVERVRLGMAKAKREGKRVGRPPLDVDASAVRALRAAGKSWSEVATELDCSVGAARRRAV